MLGLHFAFDILVLSLVFAHELLVHFSMSQFYNSNSDLLFAYDLKFHLWSSHINFITAGKAVQDSRPVRGSRCQLGH